MRECGHDAWTRNLGAPRKIDGWRGAWKHVTRREFIAAILAAAGSQFRKSAVMAGEGGPGPVNAASREVDWDGLGRSIKGSG